MPRIDRIDRLHFRLEEIDELEGKYLAATNALCGFSTDEDGQPKIDVRDPEALQSLSTLLKKIRGEREAIQDGLRQLESVAGEGCRLEDIRRCARQNREYAARLRSEFMNKFDNIARRRSSGCLMPAEVMELPEYRNAEAEFVPSIRAAEEAAHQNNELAARVSEILAELPN